MNHVDNLKHLIRVHEEVFGDSPAKLVMNRTTYRKLAEAIGACDRELGDQKWANIPVRLSDRLPTGSFSFDRDEAQRYELASVYGDRDASLS